MIKPYETLKFISLPVSIEVAQPPSLPELTHLDDPIFNVFVDFQLHRPATINAKQSIDDALLEMKANSAHMLLVLDDNKHIIGLLSSQALHGERPYKIIQEGREKHSDISVASIMLSSDHILCFDYESITSAKIGHLVETFKKHRRHYALVVKKDEAGRAHVQGYFSASRIGRTLSLNTAADHVSTSTIQELQSMLREFE